MCNKRWISNACWVRSRFITVTRSTKISRTSNSDISVCARSILSYNRLIDVSESFLD
jgi:hypothetical protein